MPPEETQAERLDRAMADVQERARSIFAEAVVHHDLRPDGEFVETSAEPPGVMLSVPIKSKLGLEPSEHQSKARMIEGELMSGKRARRRRQG